MAGDALVFPRGHERGAEEVELAWLAWVGTCFVERSAGARTPPPSETSDVNSSMMQQLTDKMQHLAVDMLACGRRPLEREAVQAVIPITSASPWSPARLGNTTRRIIGLAASSFAGVGERACLRDLQPALQLVRHARALFPVDESGRLLDLDLRCCSRLSVWVVSRARLVSS